MAVRRYLSVNPDTLTRRKPSTHPSRHFRYPRDGARQMRRGEHHGTCRSRSRCSFSSKDPHYIKKKGGLQESCSFPDRGVSLNGAELAGAEESRGDFPHLRFSPSALGTHILGGKGRLVQPRLLFHVARLLTGSPLDPRKRQSVLQNVIGSCTPCHFHLRERHPRFGQVELVWRCDPENLAVHTQACSDDSAVWAGREQSGTSCRLDPWRIKQQQMRGSSCTRMRQSVGPSSARGCSWGWLVPPSISCIRTYLSLRQLWRKTRMEGSERELVCPTLLESPGSRLCPRHWSCSGCGGAYS